MTRTEGLLIRRVRLEGRLTDIRVRDGRIAEIGPELKASADGARERVLDGREMYVLPGLINLHTHSGMTLMRGFREDVPLMEWLHRVWEVEAGIDAEMVYWGTRLACLEMIRSGTTCFNDQYWYIDAAARAVEESGIRAFHSYVFLDLGDPRKQELQRRECAEHYARALDWHPRNKFAVSVHAPYSVSEENMVWAAAFAGEHGLPLHIHLSETESEVAESVSRYGKSPVRRVRDLGLLSDRVLAAHALWLDEADVEMLGDAGVTAVHNVNSNLKLASGYRFLYRELREAGARVGLGTDGCGSSNNLDLLEAMKTAALLQKAWRGDPAALPLDELLSMVTVQPAEALGLEAGAIRTGALADFSLIDVHSPAFVPMHDFRANLVYSANSSCVDTVVCDGRVLMEGRRIPGEDEVLRKAAEAADRLMGKK